MGASDADCNSPAIGSGVGSRRCAGGHDGSGRRGGRRTGRGRRWNAGRRRRRHSRNARSRGRGNGRRWRSARGGCRYVTGQRSVRRGRRCPRVFLRHRDADERSGASGQNDRRSRQPRDPRLHPGAVARGGVGWSPPHCLVARGGTGSGTRSSKWSTVRSSVGVDLPGTHQPGGGTSRENFSLQGDLAAPPALMSGQHIRRLTRSGLL